MRARLRAASAETFRSLQVRNFRLFFGGQMISQIGNWLTLVAQSLLVLHITDRSGVAVGVLTACQFLPVLLVGAWAGLVADRSDKRRLLLVVQAAAMVQSFGLAAFVWSGSDSLAIVYSIALAGGVATAFDNPARRAFVVEMVPETHVQNAVSLNSAMMTGSRMIGPALAGVLILTVGYGWCFAIDGASYLAVLAGLWRMDRRELRPATRARAGKRQVREGVRYARSVPELWVPLTMMALVGMFAFNFSVVMPLFVTTSLGSTDTVFTILLSVVSVGSVIGALRSARRTSAEIRDVALAAARFGVAMLAMAAAPSVVVALPLAVLVGYTSITFMTTSTAIVQLRAAPDMRGRVLALQAIVFLGSTPIGGPVVGAVCQFLGARVGIVVGGLACLAAAALGRTAVARRSSVAPA